MLINQFLFLSHIAKKDVYNAKHIEDKIPDITNLATILLLMLKNEVENKIVGITNLATISAFNANINEVKNKISNVTNLAS